VLPVQFTANFSVWFVPVAAICDGSEPLLKIPLTTHEFAAVVVRALDIEVAEVLGSYESTAPIKLEVSQPSKDIAPPDILLAKPPFVITTSCAPEAGDV